MIVIKYKRYANSWYYVASTSLLKEQFLLIYQTYSRVTFTGPAATRTISANGTSVSMMMPTEEFTEYVHITFYQGSQGRDDIIWDIKDNKHP